MSSIPYNYKPYIDAKVSMTDNGTVDAGRQMQSPASAGSRGLAKTTQFTNNKTQMQLGQETIAESMVEIRSILNRIDGVNVPVQEDAGEKIANMAQNMTKDQFMSHADELGLTPEEAAEHYEKMQGGAHVQEKEFNPNDERDEAPREGDVVDHKDLGKVSVVKVTGSDQMGQPAEYMVQAKLSYDELMGDVELGKFESAVQEGHYPHIKSFDKLYGINDMQQYKAMADDAQSMDMGEFMDTYSSVIDMAGDFWEDHQKTSESNEGAINEDPNTLAKELASEIMRYVRKGFDHIPADALKAKAKEYLSSIKESADSGELSRLKELSGIKEDAELTDEQKKGLEAIAKKYKDREGGNGDELARGHIKALTSSGITTDGFDVEEMEAYAKKIGKDWPEWEDEIDDFLKQAPITSGMIDEMIKVLGPDWEQNEKLSAAAADVLDTSAGFVPFPEADEFDIEEDEDFEEVLGPLGFPEDETELFDAEYQGRKVPLNKPMRGDVKKFKVYVKDPKTGNVKKVNFGHGGTSAKRPTMRIRKSNPKARKSFRARHNCANPGPKTKARYWSCRKW